MKVCEASFGIKKSSTLLMYGRSIDIEMYECMARNNNLFVINSIQGAFVNKSSIVRQFFVSLQSVQWPI